MLRVSMKTRHFLIATLAVFLAGSFHAGAYAQKKVKVTKAKSKPAAKADDASASAEPDKVLYERALKSIKRGRYTEGRLSFQTLINTYPDSEYLAKAKLGLADSYYKESGTSNLIQAIEEYKNFIVFFPFLDEAAYAQMQVGMAHYRMMQKSDRDTSQAQAAEDEFQAFLLKNPQSQLVPKAEQYLRDVQEILADGDFRIARYYFLKQDYRASAARLLEVTGRYPLYSESDVALSMLGDVYLRARQLSKNEDDKNHWADLAAQCYARLLRDYPLSKLAPEAKAQLKTLGMRIPAADPKALARMQNQQKYAKQHHANVLLKFPAGMIKSSPDVYAAARSGQPNLNPPDDSLSAIDVLKQSASGPSSTVAAIGIQSGAGTGTSSAPVETESSDSTSTAPAATTPASTMGVQIIEAPAADASATTPAPAPAAADSPAPSAAAPSPDQTPPQAAQAATDTGSQAGGQPAASGSNASTGESSSKKKKGLGKLIPW